ncbi:hypothetical protein [Anaerotignum sp.]
MKKENIIGFSVVAITILVLLFFRNYSISRTYTTEEKELTKAQAAKEIPMLEITEEDYLLRDAVLELDMVQESFLPQWEEYVLLDIEECTALAGKYFPENFELKEAFMMGEIVGLDFRSDTVRIIYEINGKENFYKTLAALDQDGRGEPIYTNHNNEKFTKLKERLEKIEIKLN